MTTLFSVIKNYTSGWKIIRPKQKKMNVTIIRCPLMSNCYPPWDEEYSLPHVFPCIPLQGFSFVAEGSLTVQQVGFLYAISSLFYITALLITPLLPTDILSFVLSAEWGMSNIQKV